MYKYIFFALFSLVIHPLFSQSFSSSQTTSSYALPSLNLTDAFGRLTPASGAGISGTPYMFDQFGLGKGTFINGVEFEDSSLNYSYFDHNLYFTKGNQLYLINYQLKSFVLNSIDKEYNKVSKEFMSLYPSIDNNTTSTLYEIRSNGNLFQFLKYTSKLIKESIVFSGPPIKEYILEDLFYIYDKADKKMLPLGGSLSLKAIKKALPNYVTQMDAYMNANKLNLKKEEDMIQLLQQLKASSN
jgi:hypothetical protein